MVSVGTAWKLVRNVYLIILVSTYNIIQACGLCARHVNSKVDYM